MSFVNHNILDGFQLRELFTHDQIQSRNKQLAREIAKDYAGLELVVVCTLKGAVHFFSDLMREIFIAQQVLNLQPIRMYFEFLGIQSYGGEMHSSGVVKIVSDLTRPIIGKEVLIIEDIIDTGLTMEYLVNNFKTRGPSRIKICSLLYKPSRNIKKIHIDYLGFTIEDLFVLGYGLDYKSLYRELPFIAFLEPLQQQLTSLK